MSSPVTAAEEGPIKVGTVEGITEYKYPNGFRVLLFPDASRPVVTVNLTVFCGSRHEGYGETGMAHLLEHMVFKGTPTFPQIPKALADHGARFNGTTWVDRTNYFETMPASDINLEFGISMEADRMVNSFIKREDLLSEMTVVRNEFEMGENNPEHILSQRMMSAAYEWHNYGKSTIGNRTDIERVPVDNLKEFYKKFYQPDNSMLVVAGKFDEKKALEYTTKYFGALKKPDRKLTNTYTEEPAQDGERQVVLRRVGTVGAIGLVYHVSSGPTEDYAAVQVLEDCLTSEPAGRLFKALVETKKVTSLSGSTYAWHDPGVIEITAKVENAKEIDLARDAMIQAVESLAEKPLTEEEVSRSKQRFAKFNEQLLSSSDRFAIQLSEWAGAGDWRLYFLHRDRLEKVTAADVNKAAAAYLTRNNRTVGVYYPATKAERANIPETPSVAKMLEGYKGRAVVSSGEAFDPTPENIEKRVIRGEVGSLKTAFLGKKTRGEMADIRLSLRFGNEGTLKGLAFASEALGDLLPRGTSKHTRQQITDEFDKLGARVSFSGSVGSLIVSIKAKKENLEATLKLVGEILRDPTLPESEFTLIKNEKLEQLTTQKTDPQHLAVRAMQRKLVVYPKDNIRYVPTIDESIERVKATTLEQVKELFAKQVAPQAGELVAVGEFDQAVLVGAVSTMLNGWKSDVPYKRIDRELKTAETGSTEVINTPDKANAIYFAGLALPMTDSDPDYAAMQMGNYLLGGAPLASRLSNRVRGEKGLSYGVGSGFNADATDKAGMMQIYAITNPANMQKVDVTIAEEVGKFLKEGVSLEELDSGKKGYIDSMKVQRSSDALLAVQLANGLFVGRKFDYYADLEKKIESLSPSEIQKAYQKLLDPKKLTIIQAGDFQKKN